MTQSTPDPQDTYSEAETVARREAALRNLLATPPKRHDDSKLSQSSKSGKKS